MMHRKRWVEIFNNVFAKTKDEKRAFASANASLPMHTDNKMSVVCAAGQTGFVKLDAALQKGAVGTRFKKALFPVGLKLKHPLTGQRLELDSALTNIFIEDTSKFIRDGNQCAFPDGHSDSARSNMGWWTADFTREVNPADGKEWAFGIVDVLKASDAESVEKGTIKFVSPSFLSPFEDSQERKYRGVMYHICGTPRPVIPGQSGFERVELAIGNSKRTFSALTYEQDDGGKKMSLKNFAIKLGLDESADEAKILQAIETLQVTPAQPDIKLQASLDKANAEIEKLKAQEKSRAATEAETFMASIQADATAHGVPIPKEKMDRVKKYFDAGLSDEARDLGTSYRETALAQGKKPASTFKASTSVDGIEDAKQRAVEENKSYKNMMERQGFHIQLSADGTAVEKVTPPSGDKS